ncbi:MAG: FAD/NAD(P)-binding oxidoreductase [Pseudomonadota bacterium]|nr:FAD/NAD(P)-binding oxidoreductase [Pseudomonadota bacterium]
MGSKLKIVIVGAGFGGTTVISNINRWKIRNNLELTLVEPAEWHYYRNSWLKSSISGDSNSFKPIHIADLIPSDSVNWLNEPAAQFYPEQNYLLTINGTRVDYDILVVGVGLKPKWELIEGIHGKLGRDCITTAFNFSSLDWNKKFFNETRKGKILFTISGGVSNGTIPSKEILLTANEFFKRKNIRDNLEISYLDGNQFLFPNKKISKSLSSILNAEKIEQKVSTTLLKVFPKSKEAVFYDAFNDKEYSEHYDLLHIAPKMAPPKAISQSQLSDKEGFLAVDKTTLKHKNYDNIFGIGDITNIPCVKNLSAITAQLPVLLANIGASITGLGDLKEFNGEHNFSLHSSTFKRSNYRLKFLELDDSRVWPSITTDSILGYLMAEKGNIKKYRNSIIKSRLDNLVPSKIK